MSIFWMPQRSADRCGSGRYSQNPFFAFSRALCLMSLQTHVMRRTRGKASLNGKGGLYGKVWEGSSGKGEGSHGGI